MNNKAINFIKNFSYTITSNFISVAISTLIILIVPKLIGVDEYGYWQLYLFYSSYVGFLHFGWNDGIYLRYGGEKYENLNKQLFFSQFLMLLALQSMFVISFFGVSEFLISDNNRAFILKMVALCMIIVNLRYMFIFILQATYRIKEFAKITMMDRVLYLLLIVLFLVFGITEYQILIYADLAGKLLSLLYSIYCCRDIVINRTSLFAINIKETIENIKVGSKLMISNIASKLIIGVVRFGIERGWSIAVFGKISLTLSISNFLMTFVNAIGLIIFPVLRRMSRSNLPSVYGAMRDILMILLLAVLIVYYPMKEILSIWLVEYADTLIYMSILFPLLVYEGKMSLLINTFYKTLRKEKALLRLNLITLIISVVTTFISTVVIKELSIAVFSIALLLAIRSVLGELYLSKVLNISLLKDIILELSITIVFILLGWYVDSWSITIWYGIAYLLYILIKRKDILNTIHLVRKIVSK